MNSHLSRRRFLQQSSLAAAGLGLAGCTTSTRKVSANDKLNIGVVGTANQANWNLGQIAHQNIVALCDVDDTFLAAASQKYPGAKTYNDFRRLIDQRDIDAILVATPDHTHAVATVAALRSGRHVYCEKPLTHTVSECRIVRDLAKRHRVATQMGTQIHADNNYRRVVELIQSDAIGRVREVHTWVSG
ncbi:MAG: Gfo/Idh/MocA family oxidoreductase, partial [Opitutaceae bacterium]|nr:Gfo/Idh/MocA family oxidoreductase [Verrucomicrobiales bacterium]